MSDCCGQVYVKKRVLLRPLVSIKSESRERGVLKLRLNGNQGLVDFKALAKRNGLHKRYGVKAGIYGTHNPIGQSLGSVASYVAPGNMSPARNPIRSGAWNAVTPSRPNIPGSVNVVHNRTYRCPEGYQYGGRFTDNRLSTCGAQLFDIPSALGLALGALRRVARGVRSASGINSTPITGEAMPDSIVQSRRPDIPRVGAPNVVNSTRAAKELVTAMGKTSTPVARLVRKDGFVLEPVVPAKVLRAIPDNRDMESAHYIMTAPSVGFLGGEELGMLSNSGVSKLSYVLPGGSVLSLEKKRQLTVGERRKLGRTVNSVANISTTSDPAAKLKAVATETGDGIAYSESFVGINNPNELVKKPGKDAIPKWADIAFGKGKRAAAIAESARPNQSEGKIGGKIDSVESAIAHINDGGSLAEIDPMLLGQVISRNNVLKAQKLDATQTMLTSASGRKFIQHTSKFDNEHLAQKFASDVQQALGLESPDVALVGDGSKRKYIMEDPGSMLRGYKVDRSISFQNADPRDVAKLMVSDYLTDQRTRNPANITMTTNGTDNKLIPSSNLTSGLIALDKIEVVNRQKMTINDFYTAANSDIYKQYYTKLKAEQQFSFKKEIDALIMKARAFNFTTFKAGLYSDGHLSDAEKDYLDILDKMLKQRVDTYAQSKEMLMRVLGARK